MRGGGEAFGSEFDDALVVTPLRREHEAQDAEGVSACGPQIWCGWAKRLAGHVVGVDGDEEDDEVEENAGRAQG